MCLFYILYTKFQTGYLLGVGVILIYVDMHIYVCVYICVCVCVCSCGFFVFYFISLFFPIFFLIFCFLFLSSTCDLFMKKPLHKLTLITISCNRF